MAKLSKQCGTVQNLGLLFVLALTGACSSGSVANPPPGQGSGASGGSGSGSGTGAVPGGGAGSVAGGVTGSGGSGSGGAPVGACQGNDVPLHKRLVRLSFNQISNAVTSLTNASLGATIAATYEIGDSEHRTFPPLASPREGSTLTDSTWAKGDKIAADVAKYVLDNAATVSNCGAAPSADCAKAFVLSFAERAFRRPLKDAEKANLSKVLTDVTAAGGSAADQLQYGVYAVLESPYFLYRTEFGQDSAQPGPLTAYEVANQLAFFLTDAPPDKPLLDAAAQGLLTTPDQVGAQVKRIVALPATKQNLQDAMFSYFGLYGLEEVVVDSADFTQPVRNSMQHESELFLKNILWSPKLASLLTARQSTINATLAPLYGVAAPTSGLDADGFGLVDLPANRAGMLTNLGFLTARSRPDQPSVVGRGLLVNKALLCATNPEFPKDLADTIAAASATLADATERAKSEYRTSTPPCKNCHLSFDAYGLALGNFDTVGRFQTMDSKGRAIDAAVTLPDTAGGAQVKSATEMAAALAGGGTFASCMAKNVMLYALAEVPDEGTSVASVSVNGCATQSIAAGFAKTGQSFSDLVEQVAVSNTLGQRSAGAK
jgi:Protein of unknown function (DUF1592)/Protein of unknown function (DUF1588)/Protein of unknown function (DUF1595)